jgi:hypothetical protein
LADEIGVAYFETSAKRAFNVDQVFKYFIDKERDYTAKP